MGLITPTFRVSYPNLFEPKVNSLSGKAEYSVVALFKKGEDLSALLKAEQEAIIAKWGPDKAKWPKNLRRPFKKQEDREKDGGLPEGYEEGAVYLNLKSKEAPGLVDQGRNPIMSKNDLYAGCYCRALVSVYAYDQAGNRGVSFGLQHIQKVKEGAPLGGRVRAEDAFSAIDTGESFSNEEDLFS